MRLSQEIDRPKGCREAIKMLFSIKPNRIPVKRGLQKDGIEYWEDNSFNIKCYAIDIKLSKFTAFIINNFSIYYCEEIADSPFEGWYVLANNRIALKIHNEQR